MRRRLIHLITAAQPSTLMTLTCNPARFSNPEAAVLHMNEAFTLLVKRLRRLYPGECFEYIAIWEWTVAGWPHLHVLMRAPFIPKPIISRHWLALTGAYIVDIGDVWSFGGAAKYLAKHFTKQFYTSFKLRRFRASANFFAEGMRPSQSAPSTWGRWKVAKESMLDVLLGFTHEGLIVELHDDGGARAFTWAKSGLNDALAYFKWWVSRERLFELRRGVPAPT